MSRPKIVILQTLADNIASMAFHRIKALADERKSYPILETQNDLNLLIDNQLPMSCRMERKARNGA
jgi:hypothetical protein